MDGEGVCVCVYVCAHVCLLFQPEVCLAIFWKTSVSWLGSHDLWALYLLAKGGLRIAVPHPHLKAGGGVRPLEVTAFVTLKGIFRSDSLCILSEMWVEFGTFIFPLLQPLWAACT